ncbi:ShlB/FhaC/HecB family hemolysin secretion/activation protein [Alkalinema sp. FACHB-956]|uniref:ShlB/FhaC/HecB family hemolysin secretion/activation protein n=1 Tax=Alkalinema sp. FACHB-956 TaxID=2692768 RepID=UPI001689C559|nr:ShlB/FhaC/HecB family hemolysin secretion/activation protein [Alkalinema sp. FACHB-956]MBD2329166.1 ShlB/FhaC/HecB family hemolysin secretion/activation protein [Alkalinema sp. FACHB-956]
MTYSIYTNFLATLLIGSSFLPLIARAQNTPHSVVENLPVKTQQQEGEPTKVPIQKIQLLGQSLVNQSEIDQVFARFENRSLSLQDLQDVANQVTQLYQKRGYITSRVIVPDQVLQDGTAKLLSQVGTIEAIEIASASDIDQEAGTFFKSKPILEKVDVLKVDPQRRQVHQEDIPDSRLRQYISNRLHQRIGDPVNTEQLENDLKLLKSDNTLFQHIEASLREGSNGKSILVIRAAKRNSFNLSFTSDNNSPPSVGGERFGSMVTQRNLLTFGDRLSASYFRSLSGGSNSLDFNYQIPVNSKNGTLELRYAPSRSRITDPQFEKFGIRAKSSTYELTYRQPIHRRFESEFAFSLGLAFQDGQTFLYDRYPFPFGIGPDDNGNSRTRVLQFGQDYVYRSERAAWALRSQFNLGLGIFGATQNAEPIPDGQFISWQGQVQHVKQLGNHHLLLAQLDVQLTPNSLLPSQQFVLGGGRSLRGYRQSLRTGDNGIRFSLEDRISVQRTASGQTTLYLVPFFDMGTTWNHANNPNQLEGKRFLTSMGLGLIWQPNSKMLMRLDYALPLVKIADRSNNLQDQALYFSFQYTP